MCSKETNPWASNCGTGKRRIRPSVRPGVETVASRDFGVRGVFVPGSQEQACRPKAGNLWLFLCVWMGEVVGNRGETLKMTLSADFFNTRELMVKSRANWNSFSLIVGMTGE